MQINKKHETKVVKEVLRLSQDKFIEHFNNKKNQRMISCEDVLNIDTKKEKQLTNSIRKDLEDDILLTSTQVNYEKNTVTHNVRNKAEKVIKLSKHIPTGTIYLKDIKKDSLDFLKALCGDIKLTKKQVINKFTDISGKTIEKIRFWTSSKSLRDSYPIRAVELYFDDVVFDVVCGRLPDVHDYRIVSRGVNVTASKKQGR